MAKYQNRAGIVHIIDPLHPMWKDAVKSGELVPVVEEAPVVAPAPVKKCVPCEVKKTEPVVAAEPVEPVATEETLDEVRKRYAEMFGKCAFHGWDKENLLAKMED